MNPASASRDGTVEVQFTSLDFPAFPTWKHRIEVYDEDIRRERHSHGVAGMFRGPLDEAFEACSAAMPRLPDDEPVTGPWEQVASTLGGWSEGAGRGAASPAPGESRQRQDAIGAATVAAAEEAIARARGQGFSASPERRRAIELRAMSAAAAMLRAEEWEVSDRSATEPYDLLATKGGEALFVEVKGTSTAGEQVFLTRNEVEHARAHPEASALIVVHGVEVEDGPGGPIARGGVLRVLRPWNVDEGELVPLAFQYAVPASAK